jgi:hypothetical protein
MSTSSHASAASYPQTSGTTGARPNRSPLAPNQAHLPPPPPAPAAPSLPIGGFIADGFINGWEAQVGIRPFLPCHQQEMSWSSSARIFYPFTLLGSGLDGKGRGEEEEEEEGSREGAMHDEGMQAAGVAEKGVGFCEVSPPQHPSRGPGLVVAASTNHLPPGSAPTPKAAGGGGGL